MEKRYEIRIFNERYRIEPSYYLKNKDVKRRIFADTIGELIFTWRRNLETEIGETYAVWDHENPTHPLVAGAYDPDDIEIILENFDIFRLLDFKRSFSMWHSRA